MRESKQYEYKGIRVIERLGTGSTGICLLHGYGASFTDLAPLADYPSFPEATWIFPDGPVSVPIGPGMEGRGWFPLDVVALQTAMMTGSPMDLASVRPPGMDEAVQAVLPLIQEASGRFERFFLGGFSQGSMVALDAFLSTPSLSVEGLLLLSSTLVSSESWTAGLDKVGDIRVFQSHGRQDPVLGFGSAEKLNELLGRSSAKVEWHPFDGGHEIPLSVLQSMGSFLT